MEFEANPESSEGMSSETDRSRSLHGITNAMEVRVALSKAKASPETLSQLLAGSQPGSPGVPSNSFHSPAAEGSSGPGRTFVSQIVNHA